MGLDLTIYGSCVCLPWGNGANLVEGEFLGQSEAGGVWNFLVSLREESRQSNKSIHVVYH